MFARLKWVAVPMTLLLLIGAAVAGYWGWFQQEQVLRNYHLAVEHQGKRYSTLSLSAGNTAVDEKTGHFFCRIGDLSYLIALASGAVTYQEGRSNPFLDGTVGYPARDKYVSVTTQYLNAADSVIRYDIRDAKGRIVHTFAPDQDDPYARVLVNVGMVRSSAGHGSSRVTDEYLDATRLLKDYFATDLRFDKDDEQKRVTLHFAATGR